MQLTQAAQTLTRHSSQTNAIRCHAAYLFALHLPPLVSKLKHTGREGVQSAECSSSGCARFMYFGSFVPLITAR